MEMTTEKWTRGRIGSEPRVPNLETLRMFEGVWKIQGKNMSFNPSVPSIAVHGDENYTWLPGQYFLVNHWQHFAGQDGHHGISILGYDEQQETLFTHNFDNMGYERVYLMKLDHNTWTFTGDKERAHLEFNDDWTSYTQNWEVKLEEGWKPLCIMQADKQKEI